ncbi:hypothetical protein [Streptococcus sobrinus]|uniref:hypothetical protein n=1 Tax=Streptococcus sobrinus TaxID=1310 RepID=UPI000D705800|nr:hypothetical protein [Streptococcus sobrinus]AWN62118.1 hypothetical protein DLJ52_07950 [Streptococcus sobrinus]AWN63992.1 hypothetical protein DLJ51_07955 [Streptococcus sobrinus]SQG20938.1 Uncharacterised protein [Streptococcus sobrinus]
MIENFYYDFHEFDDLVKLPNNKKFDESSDNFVSQLKGKTIQDIIHILKVSNIVGDLSLGKTHEYRELLLEKTASYVKQNFSGENIVVWDEFYSQAIMLNRLYILFSKTRDQYFEKNTTKSKLSINLLLVCLEKVLRDYTNHQILNFGIDNFEKLNHIRDILKGYASEILKFFMFKDKDKKLSYQIYSNHDIDVVCQHFNFYNSYESIKDIMEFFRFSKINISKNETFHIEIADKKFNESVLVSNFREKGVRNSRYNHLNSNLSRAKRNKELNVQEMYSEMELRNIFGENWKNIELSGIPIYYWHKAYSFIREICNEKLKKENSINQLCKMCIVEKKIKWINRLKKYLGISREGSERIIDELTFRNTSYDLIDTPFIELEDNLIIVPSISEGTAGAYAIISNFSKQSDGKNEMPQKGYALEEKIKTTLQDADVTFISHVKDNIRGENYELDHIFLIDNTVYFIECKTFPYPYTIKEHAEQQCKIYAYLKKFERNALHFIENKNLFMNRLGLENSVEIKKVFVTSTMVGVADKYNDISIIDESAFSSFFLRKSPIMWDPSTGKTLYEKNIPYYKGKITNNKIDKFLRKPASIDLMREKLGFRQEELLTHVITSLQVVENTQYMILKNNYAMTSGLFPNWVLNV